MGKFVCVVLVSAACFACGQHYEEGAHPPPKPPASAQVPVAAPTAEKPSSPVVSGTIQLAEGLRAPTAEGAVLFIIARPAPTGGPPLAVKRMAVPHFPFEYSLTQADAMMGQAIDWREIDALYLSAKIDVDGQVGGSKTGDLEGVYAGNPVAPGAFKVDILIDTVQ